MIVYYGIKLKKDDKWDWDRWDDGKPVLFSQNKDYVNSVAKSCHEKHGTEYKVEEHSRDEDLHATPLGDVVTKIKGDLFEGSWDCKGSPTKKCHFNIKNDSSCDFCLYCGEPEERK